MTEKPATEDELAALLRDATRDNTPVAVLGGGTHRDMGDSVEPSITISTAAMEGIVAWEPDDLTVVVRAGTRVAELEEELSKRGQSAVLPERAGSATVGGVVASAASGYRRLRYGPTRDRMLEVRAVTGDGRYVKGGGRVVKNVSGYDLPRLYTGSFGALGVITSVCLKLWPLTEATATVAIDDIEAVGALHRPLAVLSTRTSSTVFLAGTAAELEAEVAALGGEAIPGLEFPPPPDGQTLWSARVRPRYLDDVISRLSPGTEYVAQRGVGEVTFASDDESEVGALREWCERSGGSVVRLRGRSRLDPWGASPADLDLQRRIVSQFDPARILERGRLPGGI